MEVFEAVHASSILSSMQSFCMASACVRFAMLSPEAGWGGWRPAQQGGGASRCGLECQGLEMSGWLSRSPSTNAAYCRLADECESQALLDAARAAAELPPEPDARDMGRGKRR